MNDINDKLRKSLDSGDNYEFTKVLKELTTEAFIDSDDSRDKVAYLDRMMKLNDTLIKLEGQKKAVSEEEAAARAGDAALRDAIKSKRKGFNNE